MVVVLLCACQKITYSLFQDTPPRKRFNDRVSRGISFFRKTSVTSRFQFETISHFLSPREPAPLMHLDRTEEEEDLTLPSPTTRCRTFVLTLNSLLTHF